MGCIFCVTGTLGLMAQLSAADIAEQFLKVGKRSVESISHVVLMGMGEPLDNYDNVARARRTLTHPEWSGLSPERLLSRPAGWHRL